jgi:hypothetical protein
METTKNDPKMDRYFWLYRAGNCIVPIVQAGRRERSSSTGYRRWDCGGLTKWLAIIAEVKHSLIIDSGLRGATP